MVKTRALAAVSQEGSGHAVIVGGGIAGLLAGRVLEDHFDHITIIERDDLPAQPTLHFSQAHRAHVHALAVRGYQIIEQLLPGFDAELAEAGAHAGDVGLDVAIRLPTGWLPRFKTGLSGRACSRHLLDFTLRKRLERQGKITWISRTKVVGLIGSRDGCIVRGVRVISERGHSEIGADFVVDASGRSSLTPSWLVSIGYERTPETIVGPSMGYSTRRFRRPLDKEHDWSALMICARPPEIPRYGVLMPEEENRWGVALIGVAPDIPPADDSGFLEFASRLVDPIIFEAIKDAEPVSSILRYRRSENRLRHYERLVRWPERFVVLGDATCMPNPIYGQGMTLAALAAMTLKRCLESATHRQGRGAMSGYFQRELAACNRMPWLLAISEDLRYSTIKASPRTPLAGLVQWYVDKLLVAAPDSIAISKALLEVINLVDPYALVRPSVIGRVLGNALRIT